MFSERSINGSIDEIPLPGSISGSTTGSLTGRLWLCGKHFIGPDHGAAIERVAADRVVCLVEQHELAGRYDAYLDWLHQQAGLETPIAWWSPMPDLSVKPDALIDVVRKIVRALMTGETVIVHCAAGIGRAGTTAAAVLIALGADEGSALTSVANARPMAGPEAGAQREFLRDPRLRDPDPNHNDPNHNDRDPDPRVRDHSGRAPGTPVT